MRSTGSTHRSAAAGASATPGPLRSPSLSPAAAPSARADVVRSNETAATAFAGQRFVVKGSGEGLGPMTLEQLRAMAAARQLRPTSHVRTTAGDEWFDAKD